MYLRRNRFRTIHTVAAVTACLFAFSGMARADRVLCFGEDGHVNVERGLDGACADAGGQANRGCTETDLHFDAAAPTHCGPCKDIPLNTTVDQHSAHRPSSEAIANAVSAVALPCFHLVSQTIAPRSDLHEIGHAPPHALLRTVSLIC